MYYLLIFWAISSTGAALTVDKIEFDSQASCLVAAKAVNDARTNYMINNVALVCVKR